MDRFDSQRPPEDINPFAPPKITVTRAEDVRDVPAVVRRDGDLMLVGPDAVFEPICFVTGEPAVSSVKVDTVWQPAWVYLSLLPGLIPYLFVSPWFVQRVSLRVPIGPRVVRAQRRRTWVGAAVAIAAIVAGFVAALFALPVSFTACIATFFLGIFVAIQRPVRLHIAYADKELLVLRKVHPACLEGLPSLGNN